MCGGLHVADERRSSHSVRPYACCCLWRCTYLYDNVAWLCCLARCRFWRHTGSRVGLGWFCSIAPYHPSRFQHIPSRLALLPFAGPVVLLRRPGHRGRADIPVPSYPAVGSWRRDCDYISFLTGATLCRRRRFRSSHALCERHDISRCLIVDDALLPQARP